MNIAIILIGSFILLALGYIFYGGWLAKQWGVEPDRKTPAHELEDGMDYVPAKTPVLMGHHFSSIAGAGPINGPIQAAIFGWVPVLLWVRSLPRSATKASPLAKSFTTLWDGAPNASSWCSAS